MSRNKDKELHRNWNHLDYFGKEKEDLTKEVKNHPQLLALLANHPVDEFEIKLAEIAAYCEVILDGEYSQGEIRHLCKILTEKLIHKRTGIVFTRDTQIH